MIRKAGIAVIAGIAVVVGIAVALPMNQWNPPPGTQDNPSIGDDVMLGAQQNVTDAPSMTSTTDAQSDIQESPAGDQDGEDDGEEDDGPKHYVINVVDKPIITN